MVVVEFVQTSTRNIFKETNVIRLTAQYRRSFITTFITTLEYFYTVKYDEDGNKAAMIR